LRHFRSVSGDECDFVLDDGRMLIPIEVKTTQTPGARDAAGLGTFLNLFAKLAPWGILLYPGKDFFPLAARIFAVPMRAVLAGESD